MKLGPPDVHLMDSHLLTSQGVQSWMGSDYIRTVYMRENKPRMTQSAAYVSRELSHLYGHSLSKEFVRGLRKPRTSFSCRLYEQFAAYISHGLCNPWLISHRINGPIVLSGQDNEVVSSLKCQVTFEQLISEGFSAFTNQIVHTMKTEWTVVCAVKHWIVY